MSDVLIFILAVVYLGIGVAIMFWIKRDSEFRGMGTADLLAYGSIILWPLFGILYVLMKPQEQLDDLAAKKSVQDFKNFMRTRKASESDFGKSIDKYKKTAPDAPLELVKPEEEFRDYHLEELINACEWMEALRTANDMLRFAREQQEHQRIDSYERYIREIKDKRLQEMG